MIEQPLWLDDEWPILGRRPLTSLTLHGTIALPIAGVLVDTGADHTTLPLAAARAAGVSLHAASTVRVHGATGALAARRLAVRLTVAGRSVRAPVTFLADAPPLLGRSTLFRLWSDVVFAPAAWGQRTASPSTASTVAAPTPHEEAQARIARAIAHAMHAADAGEHSEAADVLAAAHGDGDDFAGYWLGRLQSAVGDLAAASDTLTAVVGAAGTFAPHARVALGDVHLRAGDPAEARLLWEDTVREGQSYAAPEAALRLALSARADGDDDRYVHWLRVAAEGGWGISGGDESPVRRAQRLLAERG